MKNQPIDLFKRFSFLYFVLTGSLAVSMLFASGNYFVNNDLPGQIYIILIVIFIALFHIITGIGIVLEKKWGYFFFESYLFLAYFAFPIGTFIAYKVNKFIKDFKIKEFF